MIRRGGPQLRRVRREQRGTLFLKLLCGGDGAAYVPTISEIFNKIIISLNVCSVSHCSYWLLCCVYDSKVTIIITLKISYYFFSRLFVQTLKVLHSFIHSFIHTEHLYSASSRELLRGAPDSSTAKKSSIWNYIYSLKCRGLNEHF